MLVQHLIETGEGGEWNFGPNLNEKISVGELVSTFADKWGVSGSRWNLENQTQLHESGYLLLDSEKARNSLGWADKLNFASSVEWTVDWYLKDTKEMSYAITRDQIERFFKHSQKGDVNV
jgi:CDP-glucose 4,6-dehydratase